MGDIDIVIRRDGGVWLHEGSPIGREAMVRLFSTILRKDPDGICLVTPVEKLRITVEDAPFIAVRVDEAGGALKFVTNVGDEVEAGPDHAIRVEMDADGTPRPYLHVRRGLEALIARPVFYELVDLAQERGTPDGPELWASPSNGAWFPVGPPGRICYERALRISRDELQRLDSAAERHLDPLDGGMLVHGRARARTSTSTAPLPRLPATSRPSRPRC